MLLNWRLVAFRLHSLLGLILGLYFLLIGLSGSILVFGQELIDASAPIQVEQQERQLEATNQSIVDAVEKTYKPYKVQWIGYREDDRLPATVFAEEGFNRIMVLVSTDDAQVLGRVNPVIEFLRFFHFDLLNIRGGRQINAIGAVLLLVMAISGSLIWLDRKLRTKPKSNGKVSLKSFHTILGLWILPMLLIWSVSAIYFGYPQQFKALFTPLLSSSALKEMPVSDREREIRIDDRVRLAKDKFSDLRLAWVKVPQSAGDPIKLLFLPKEVDFSTKHLYTTVTIEAEKIKILGHHRNVSVEKCGSILSSLHFGDFGGLPVKIVWSVLGLVPGILFVSGFLIWKKRQSKKS